MEKNIYFIINRILVHNKNDYTIDIKNIYNEDFKIEINGEIKYLEKDSIIKEKICGQNFFTKVFINNSELEFSFNLETYEPKGFGENCLVETPNGRKKIKEINNGEIILNKNGESVKIINVFIFIITNDINNKPILIEKSKCGINLPYSDIIVSIKSNLKIKKVVLKGRSLYLNGKAKIYTFEDEMKYYALEVENKDDYFLSGFIVESL